MLARTEIESKTSERDLEVNITCVRNFDKYVN